MPILERLRAFSRSLAGTAIQVASTNLLSTGATQALNSVFSTTRTRGAAYGAFVGQAFGLGNALGAGIQSVQTQIPQALETRQLRRLLGYSFLSTTLWAVVLYIFLGLTSLIVGGSISDASVLHGMLQATYGFMAFGGPLFFLTAFLAFSFSLGLEHPYYGIAACTGRLLFNTAFSFLARDLSGDNAYRAAGATEALGFLVTTLVHVGLLYRNERGRFVDGPAPENPIQFTHQVRQGFVYGLAALPANLQNALQMNILTNRLRHQTEGMSALNIIGSAESFNLLCTGLVFQVLLMKVIAESRAGTNPHSPVRLHSIATLYCLASSLVIGGAIIVPMGPHTRGFYGDPTNGPAGQYTTWALASLATGTTAQSYLGTGSLWASDHARIAAAINILTYAAIFGLSDYELGSHPERGINNFYISTITVMMVTMLIKHLLAYCLLPQQAENQPTTSTAHITDFNVEQGETVEEAMNRALDNEQQPLITDRAPEAERTEPTEARQHRHCVIL